MLLDLQATQATLVESNATLVDSNVEMKSLLISCIGSMHGTLPSKVRDEVVEASTSSFADPKFWKEILATVDNHNGKFPSCEDMGMFEDPITAHLMIDPVVCSDGNTYCRWTIIDNNLTTNPLNVDEKLTIVIDNLAFRRGLFEKFPKQSQIFRQRRNEYRGHALSLAGQGLLGDAILALQYVLLWDKHDVECVESLAQVERALREAKEKYLQPSMELSSKFVKAGPSGSKMDGEDDSCIELDEAKALVKNLSSSVEEAIQRRKGVYDDACRIGETVVFNSYLFLHESTISGLLQSLPTKPQGLQDVLERIGVVLKKGSSASHVEATSVLDHLFVRNFRDNVSVNFRTMHALVTSVGNGASPAQQSVIRALSNLCHLQENKVRAIEVGVVPMLLGVIASLPAKELWFALPLVQELLKDAKIRRVFRLQVRARTWVDIIASGTPRRYSPRNSRNTVSDAASILCTLCADDLRYCEEARACRLRERITPGDVKTRSVVELLNLLKC